MGGGTPISGWEHSADLTIYLALIHGALTPKFVKSPLYPRELEGVGHDTDRCISLNHYVASIMNVCAASTSCNLTSNISILYKGNVCNSCYVGTSDLCVDDLRIPGHLVLSCISDQPLSISEGYIAGSGTITLIISDDIHFTMLEHSNTRIGIIAVEDISSLKSVQSLFYSQIIWCSCLLSEGKIAEIA